MKEELKKLKKIILSQPDEFTLTTIRYQYFLEKFKNTPLRPIVIDGKLVFKDNIIPASEWNRIAVYTHYAIKELIDEKKIKLIREEKASRGVWNRKLYKVVR